jgi:hypothetical protein
MIPQCCGLVNSHVGIKLGWAHSVSNNDHRKIANASRIALSTPKNAAINPWHCNRIMQSMMKTTEVRFLVELLWFHV